MIAGDDLERLRALVAAAAHLCERISAAAAELDVTDHIRASLIGAGRDVGGGHALLEHVVDDLRPCATSNETYCPGDERLVELCRKAHEFFPDLPFLIVLAPIDGTPIKSMSNLTTRLQARLVASLHRSFEGGEAVEVGPVPIRVKDL